MKTNGLFQGLLLATVLAAGFLVVWGVIGMWAVEVGASATLRHREVEFLLFQVDGAARVGHTVSRTGMRYRDLEGRPVPPPEHGQEPQPPALLPAARAGSQDRVLPWLLRMRSFTDGRVPAAYWYFVSKGQPDGAGYFVGYDSLTCTRIGYLGTAGFGPTPPPREQRIPFAGATFGTRAGVFCTQGDRNPTEHPSGNYQAARVPRGFPLPWHVFVLGRDGKVYRADLQEHTLRVVLEEPRLRSAALVSPVPEPVEGGFRRLAVRTEQEVLVLDESGRVLERYPIPEVLRGGDVWFRQTSAAEAVMFSKSAPDFLAEKEDYHICWVAPGGRHREAEVRLQNQVVAPGVQHWGALVVPSPLAAASLVGGLRTPDHLDSGRAATPWQALRLSLTEFGPLLASAQLLAALLAVLCYRRQVRYGVGRAERIAWPLFVLLLGLPGWVGYRFGRSWPVLEACPACGTRAPRDRGDCAHCEEAFPRAALTGAEVFA
jgi:hypothetical protein